MTVRSKDKTPSRFPPAMRLTNPSVDLVTPPYMHWDIEVVLPEKFACSLLLHDILVDCA